MTSLNSHYLPDPHSYAMPREAWVTAIHLDLELNQAAKTLSGTARLVTDGPVPKIVLDTHDLNIQSITDLNGQALPWSLGPKDPILGQPLSITKPAGPFEIVIHYATSPSAGALQWLPKASVASPTPFMFSQGQTILSRSWFPCQDTPQVRAAWSARISTATPQTILMSGLQTTEADLNLPPKNSLVACFKSPHPVPSYLVAIAAGDLVFRSLGPRTGVWALREVADAAAAEFRDMEEMVQAAEHLYGPYDWGRFDALILPPSFPFGGMENPCLTFITPTLITGDRSLVSTVVHELAHAWSGNKVTNSTWADTWLNEGLTMYAEHRLLESLYGSEIAELHRAVDGRQLSQNIQELGDNSPDTHLVLDLTNRDPDDAFTYIPYYKGVAVWRHLESLLTRSVFDQALKKYINTFAWQSISHLDWLDFWRQELSPEAWVKLDAEAWLHQPATPRLVDASISFPESILLTEAAILTPRLLQEPTKVASEGLVKSWHPHQWLAFVHAIPSNTPSNILADLDSVFKLSSSPNLEIRFAWCHKALSLGDTTAWAGAADLVSRVGRIKMVKPLYQVMQSQDPAATKKLYASNQAGYHPVLVKALNSFINLNKPVQR